MSFKIDFIDAVYVKDFYNNIIPQMRTYFANYSDQDLIMNFSDLNYISPGVIPNILNIADIYKNFFKNQKVIELTLSWNPQLLAYLDSLNFFNICNNLSLFDYNPQMVGGFDVYKTKNNCNLIASLKGATEDQIIDNVSKLMKTMVIAEKYDPSFMDNQDIFSRIFFHIIHNSNDSYRGNSNSFGICQVNNFKSGKFVYISLCDNGNGIKDTIKHKYKVGDDTPYFKNTTDHTFGYLLEAIFWRKRKPIQHGLYHVFDMIFKAGGIIAIHSYDTYAYFNKKNFENEFIKITDYIERSQSQDMYPSDITDLEKSLVKTRKYKGVHIDIEIPLGGIK